MHDTLISAEALAALAKSRTPLLVADCSFDLADPTAGERAHAAAGHIPGARYVHLDHALSGTKTGANGRHPLPSREDFVATIAALGADDDMQIVAYDSTGGMYATRLWWMLRWAGHRAAAVLDGGLAAWKAAGLPLEAGAAPPQRRGNFSLRDPIGAVADYAAVLANLTSGDRLVIDARAPDRFRGENETLDPVGGHIPGAANRFFRDNLGPDGRFKPAAQLRAEFDAVMRGLPATRTIAQCGSGVTACHNLLAMEVAGLGGGALYVGSWSEWCAQPGSPVATGPG